MKYIKLFMLLAVVAFMGSCSDDDESWNSKSGVTVSMVNESMRFKESVGIVKVPIKVEGEANGPVSVTVEVKETGSNPAKENVNYYITTKTIKISDNTGNVELECVDDDEINKEGDRTFEISIVSAKGATVGSNATTAITLRDNDSEFYEKLQGSWVMNCTFNKAPTKWDVKIVGATDENDKDYNKVLYITGMIGYQWTTAKLSYDYNKATGKGSVAFDYLGQYNFAEGVNFNGLGVCNVRLFSVAGNQLSEDPIYGTWSDDFKNITFDEGTLYGGVFDSSDAHKGGWFEISNITMTKK